jgi:hypothetical protein
MTPADADGSPAAVVTGEPATISQPLASPRMTDRQLFPDIVPSPSAIDNSVL